MDLISFADRKKYHVSDCQANCVCVFSADLCVDLNHFIIMYSPTLLIVIKNWKKRRVRWEVSLILQCIANSGMSLYLNGFPSIFS